MVCGVINSPVSPKFPHVPLTVYVDGLWATKSECVGWAISFQDFQPMWSRSTNVTDRRTCNRKTALCTIVHRAVKMQHCSSLISHNIQ